MYTFNKHLTVIKRAILVKKKLQMKTFELNSSNRVTSTVYNLKHFILLKTNCLFMLLLLVFICLN